MWLDNNGAKQNTQTDFEMEHSPGIFVLVMLRIKITLPLQDGY